MATSWFFPPVHGGQRAGFRDASIAIFSTDAIRSMTREVLQNSIDAASAQPVRVTFSRMAVPQKDIPGFEVLAGHIAECAKDADRRFTRGTPAWIENGGDVAHEAVRLLGTGHVSVLRIRDENTKGLSGAEKGDEKEDSDWDRLIRKKGTPQLHGVGGGSFGVGQGAPFAAAKLRTVFYGTFTSAFSFIGKSIWWSIPIPDDHTQNVGYWGLFDSTRGRIAPVIDPATLPSFFRRTTRGTDLFLLGFDPTPSSDWKDAITDAVLINYFAAIHAGRLEVALEEATGRQTISTLTAAAMVAARAKATAAQGRTRPKADTHDDLVRTGFFLDALTKGTAHSGKTDALGAVRFHIIKDVEKGPNRIAWMRAPLMLVHSKTNNTLRDYAGVFVCEDPKGNALLRTLEGPEHNHWDNKTPLRATAIREMNAFVKTVLETLAGLNNAEEQDVPGLASYLPEELPSHAGRLAGPVTVTERRQKEETGKLALRIERPKVVKGRTQPPAVVPGRIPAASAVPGEGIEGAFGQGRGGGGGQSSNPGGEFPGVGKGSHGRPGESRRLRSADVRPRTWFDTTGECFLLLKSARAGAAELQLKAVGADGPPSVLRLSGAVDVATNQALPVADGRLPIVELLREVPRKLRLTFAPHRKAALTVEVVE